MQFNQIDTHCALCVPVCEQVFLCTPISHLKARMNSAYGYCEQPIFEANDFSNISHFEMCPYK